MKFITTTKTFFLSKLSVIGLGAALLATQLSASVISVNINAAAGTRPMAPTDLAGLSADGVRVANWNNLTQPFNGTVTGDDLIFNNGTTVGGTFAIQYITSRRTSLTATSDTNDVQMFNGNNTLFEGDSLTVNLNNIPFTLYDLYIYTSGQTPTRGGSISLSGGTTFYNRGGGLPDATGAGYAQITTTSFDPLNPSAVGSGNFVKFAGLSGANQSFSLTALNMGDATQRHRFHGFQIVQIPEPSTVLLVGMMSFAVLLFRRRRS